MIILRRLAFPFLFLLSLPLSVPFLALMILAAPIGWVVGGGGGAETAASVPGSLVIVIRSIPFAVLWGVSISEADERASEFMGMGGI